MMLISGAFISGCFEHRPGALQSADAQRGRISALMPARENPVALSSWYGAILKQDKWVGGYHPEIWEGHGQVRKGVGWISGSRPDQQPPCINRLRRKGLWHQNALECFQNCPSA